MGRRVSDDPFHCTSACAAAVTDNLPREKSFHRGRIRQKTLQGAKKQSRRKGAADD